MEKKCKCQCHQYHVTKSQKLKTEIMCMIIIRVTFKKQLSNKCYCFNSNYFSSHYFLIEFVRFYLPFISLHNACIKWFSWFRFYNEITVNRNCVTFCLKWKCYLFVYFIVEWCLWIIRYSNFIIGVTFEFNQCLTNGRNAFFRLVKAILFAFTLFRFSVLHIIIWTVSKTIRQSHVTVNVRILPLFKLLLLVKTNNT